MLYQSIYVPEGAKPPERDIIKNPTISIYAEKWGKENDYGFLAIDGKNEPVGAVWLRMFTSKNKGYGYIDDNTPELAIAVLPEYRGNGIGTMLLKEIISSVVNIFNRISLSVTIGNPAIHLYLRHGFNLVKEEGDSVTMECITDNCINVIQPAAQPND